MMLRRLSRLNPVRAVRRFQRLVESLESIPDLQTKVEQCMVAYQKDARFADRVPAFLAKVGTDRVLAHVRAAVERAQLHHDPCAHVVIDRVVPEDVYDELMSALPAPVFFKRQDRTREEMQVPFVFAPKYSRVVWDFFIQQIMEEALVPALTEKFRPALDDFLAKYWPGLGSWSESGLDLRVSNSRLLLRRPGYVIKPHRDPRWAFLTCLFYLQKRDAGQVYGTQLYRLRDEREAPHNSPFWVDYKECELVTDVPGGRNTALVFLNSTGVHGASIPADAPPDLERYVYQGQLSPDEAMKQQLIATLTGSDRRNWTTKYRDY